MVINKDTMLLREKNMPLEDRISFCIRMAFDYGDIRNPERHHRNVEMISKCVSMWVEDGMPGASNHTPVPCDVESYNYTEVMEGTVGGNEVIVAGHTGVCGFRNITFKAIRYNGTNGHEIARWAKALGIRCPIESPVLEPDENNPSGEYLQLSTANLGNKTCAVGEWMVVLADGKNGFVNDKQISEIIK